MPQNQNAPAQQPYQVQKVSVVVAGADIQVREFIVACGEEIPWHRHSAVTDWCYCLEGKVKAEIVEAGSVAGVKTLTLTPGQSCRIDAGHKHRLLNGGDSVCRYLLVQGGGKYDFIKVTEPFGPGNQ